MNESKYTREQTLWRMNDEDSPESFIVQKVHYDYPHESWVYYDGNVWWLEEYVHFSKILLLEYNLKKAKDELYAELCKKGTP